MQTYLAVNIPQAILLSNRFRSSKHRLCEPVVRKDFSGYWICKGPPNHPNGSTKPGKVLVHIHGGGYVAGHPLGSLAQFLRVSELAAEQDIMLGIFAIRYSLGPLAHFPQQAKEAVAAYKYLLEELHIAPEDIILEGDSAGGHLVLSLLQEIAKRALPSSGGSILIYPWVNLDNSGDSFRRNRHKDVLTKPGLDDAANKVLGPDGRQKFGDIVDFSTARVGAQTWKKILPKTWVSTGEHDCFVDDIVKFVDNARRDGADVGLQFTAGKAHAWITFDDARDIHSYISLDPSASVGNRMPGAQHIYEGLSAILHGSNLR